jgi:hypothetical protein
LSAALIDLDKSQIVFQQLSEKLNPVGFSAKQAKERADYSTAVRRITEKKIHEAEVFQKQRDERLTEMKQRQTDREILQKNAEVISVC